MDIAVNSLTGQIVYANKIEYDNGYYKCKKCNAPVIWVNSRVQRSHFRHLRGEASDDCDYYSRIYMQQDLCDFEYQSQGLPIVLDCQYDDWNLLLQLPEFDKYDVDRIGINNFYDLKFQVDDCTLVESAKLWPGKKGFLCDILPHSYDYKVECISDIENFDFSTWTIGAKGLDPSGVFFKHPAEGGNRIRIGKSIDINSTIFLLAHDDLISVQEAQWPSSLKVRKLNKKQDWCIWEIQIPNNLNEDISHWLGKFKYYFVDSGFKLDLLWPTPYLKENDGSFCIDSNGIILNIINQSSQTNILLFHLYNNQIETYRLENFVNNSKTLCLENLKHGFHRIFIDRYSNTIDLNIQPKASLSFNKEVSIGASLLLRNKIISFNLNENYCEQEIVLENEINDYQMGLDIIGLNGMQVRVLFESGLFVRHIIYEHIPSRINNIFDIIKFSFDSITFDFIGYGLLRLNFNKNKMKTMDLIDQRNIIWLLKKTYMESLSMVDCYSSPRATQDLEKIMTLINGVNVEESIKSQIVSYIYKIKIRRNISFKMHGYLFNIVSILKNKQEEGNVYGKDNFGVI